MEKLHVRSVISARSSVPPLKAQRPRSLERPWSLSGQIRFPSWRKYHELIAGFFAGNPNEPNSMMKYFAAAFVESLAWINGLANCD
jgi:hypothetical protein